MYEKKCTLAQKLRDECVVVLNVILTSLCRHLVTGAFFSCCESVYSTKKSHLSAINVNLYVIVGKSNKTSRFLCCLLPRLSHRGRQFMCLMTGSPDLTPRHSGDRPLQQWRHYWHSIKPLKNLIRTATGSLLPPLHCKKTSSGLSWWGWWC